MDQNLLFSVEYEFKKWFWIIAVGWLGKSNIVAAIVYHRSTASHLNARHVYTLGRPMVGKCIYIAFSKKSEKISMWVKNMNRFIIRKKLKSKLMNYREWNTQWNNWALVRARSLAHDGHLRPSAEPSPLIHYPHWIIFSLILFHMCNVF